MLKKHQSYTRFELATAFLAACLVWVIEIDQSRKDQTEKRFGGGEALLLWLLLSVGLHLLGPSVSACYQWLYECRFDELDRQTLQPTVPVPRRQLKKQRTVRVFRTKGVDSNDQL